MAAGFKTATVTSGDVPATQTDFPSYIDLSRLGITTQAEADSVRVYADAGKTTQWAREIVSVSQMWVKIPSLTSTTAIYVEWDGVSADYAVTDTYGRNAVWSDYLAVFHFESSNANSTSGSYSGTDTSMTYGSSYGKFGGGADFNGTSSRIAFSSTMIPITTNPWSITMWVNQDILATGNKEFFSQWTYATSGNAYFLGTNSNTRIRMSDAWSYDLTTNWTADTWRYVANTNTASNNHLYTNATLRGSKGSAMSFTGTGVAMFGRQGEYADEYFDGFLDEARVRLSTLSQDWITTEYNNQSDEAGFWGTWSDVSSGNTTNFFALMTA
jgi:hypothetical protein